MRGVFGYGLVAAGLGAAAGTRWVRRRVDSTRSGDLLLAHAITREVGGLVDPAAVYRTAVSMLATRLRHEGVAILEVRGGRLVLVAAEGALTIEPGYAQGADEGLLGLAVRTGATVVSDDVHVDPRCIVAPGMEALRSEAVIPLRDRDGVVRAVLDVTSPRPGRFGAHERALLGTVAGALEGAVTSASLYRHLEARAATDPLTGLPNHRTFHERLREAVAGARAGASPLSLCLLDVDRFKEINDAEGHQAGDRVLVRIARALAGAVRTGETIARIGGDEFAWILPGADGAAAYAAVERARAHVAHELRDLGVALSAGLCDLDDAPCAEDLFRLADGALYWAKAQGKGVTVRYSPAVVESLSAEERAAQAERRQALKGLRALARAVDAKDPTTRDHSVRVAHMAVAVARRVGWPEDAVARLREAALLHDVGKIGIPDAILRSDGPLTAEEYAVIRTHSTLGARIAAEVLTPEQTSWVRGHHERLDGGGYPDGLAGDAIPEGARLLAVADAWDAMTSDRPYRRGMDHAEARAECLRIAGTQLCPVLVAALLEVVAAREGREEGAAPPPAVTVSGRP